MIFLCDLSLDEMSKHLKFAMGSFMADKNI